MSSTMLRRDAGLLRLALDLLAVLVGAGQEIRVVASCAEPGHQSAATVV
jgi:hypothetical protein